MEQKISKPRICPKCNEHKQGDKFYNHLSFYCIPCANEYSRDRRKKITLGEVYIIKKVKNNKWKEYLHSKGVKYCYKCENVKPLEHFSKDNSSKLGRTSHCKKCIKWELIKTNKKKEEDYIKEKRSSEWYKNYLKKLKKSKGPNLTKARENQDKFYNKMKLIKRETRLYFN